jgi:hypothetical protein
MVEKRFGRREFLKITIATAAAAGLSHFRILNIGGVDVAFAGLCDNGREDPDVCSETSPDECNPPEDPDYCDISLQQDSDQCGEPGVPDTCDPTPGDPDICRAPGNVDICEPQQTDLCTGPVGGNQEPDICDPPNDDPDDPNAVQIETFNAKSADKAAFAAMPALGGLVAALGAAALWLRSLGKSKGDRET